MTDTVLLEFYIKESGFKKGYLAQCLGITLNAFGKKVKGKREFKASEIQALCSLININDVDLKERIFFASKVN